MEACIKDLMSAKTYKGLNYRLYLPDNIKNDKKYSFVLFLHGAGERGNDNLLHINNSDNGTDILLKELLNSKYREDVIVAAPQCPTDEKWNNADWAKGSYVFEKDNITPVLQRVIDLLFEDIFTNYPIDMDRLYITGLSMGGYGTWDFITRYPDLFAAAVPVCGGCDLSAADIVKQIPIWIFHCPNDNIVDYKTSKLMYEKLKENGSPVRYTEYMLKHACWRGAYTNEELFPWMFGNKKKRL